MDLQYDHVFKLLVIGDSGVGKSSLLLRFTDDIFSGDHLTPTGLDFRTKTVEMNGELIQLHIWDTAGQERFRTITSSFFTGAHGVVVVYDVTRAASFRNVGKWLTEVDSHCNLSSKILVGNKNDDPRRKEVLTDDAHTLAKKMDLQLFETSAKENVQVEEMFMAITRQVLLAEKVKQKKESLTAARASISLMRGRNQGQRLCCF